MQKRGFLVLCAVTVVAVVLAVVAVATAERDTVGAPQSEPAFAGLAAHLSDVAAVKVHSQELTATFLRKGEAWEIGERAGYPADAGRIRHVVLALADLTLVEPKTREPSLYSRLGVEDTDKGKSHLVTVTGKDGKTLAELIVGDQRYDRLGTGNNGVYVRKPGEAQSWLAAGTLDLDGDLASWVERRIIDLPADRFASVALTEADGTKLTLSRKSATDKFALAELPAGAKLKNEDAAGQPASVLEELDLEDVAPAAAMPIPATGVTTASLTAFDGLSVEVRLFRHDDKNWVAIGANGNGKAAAEAQNINKRVANWRYRIGSEKANLLAIKLADLLASPKS